MQHLEESITVPLVSGQQLHVRRIVVDVRGVPVVLLHDWFEDGKVFYPKAKQGLAYELADHGYDVYIVDLRGKGRSWPPVLDDVKCGIHDVVCQDIPAVAKFIQKRRKISAPMLWLTHGWSGVLLKSAMVRTTDAWSTAIGVAHLGISPCYAGSALSELTAFVWQHKISKFKAGRLLKGRRHWVTFDSMSGCYEKEHAQLYRESLSWIIDDQWVDPIDGFDYLAAMQDNSESTRCLYLSCVGSNQSAYANALRAFVKNLGSHDGRLVLLQNDKEPSESKHIDMLSSKSWLNEYVDLLLVWMQQSVMLVNEGVMSDMHAKALPPKSVDRLSKSKLLIEKC